MALELSRPILQIVGYQNSGKTTLITKLIEKLSTEGFSVGTIKHHGHGGEPLIGDSGKDTELHRKAGASVVAVEGKGVVQLTAANSSWKLEKLIALYKSFEIDVILVEGYKKANYPKIVLLRNGEDKELLDELTNIACVISRTSIDESDQYSYPFYLRTQEDEYILYVMDQMKGQGL
jgi:molybdopterin-guanine dinucleotide biosynthesis protein B